MTSSSASPPAPGQANAVNVTADNTTCTSLVATTTIPVDDVDAERGIVALQGKPRVISIADPTALMAVRAVTPTYEWIVGSGDCRSWRAAMSSTPANA
jgi:hypothetical protein